jgi:hypothetical protein
MACGTTRFAKLSGYEVIFFGRSRNMKLYCEQELFKQICNYYRFHKMSFGGVHLGRRVNEKFRESVQFKPFSFIVSLRCNARQMMRFAGTSPFAPT